MAHESRSGPIVVVFSTPLEDEHVERIAAVDRERVQILHRPDLLPVPRFVADHHGEPGWRRSPELENEWRAIASQAEVLWDLPEGNDIPVLEQCPRLRWLQTTSAGVGPLIRNAGLADTEVIVTTSSGIHATPLAEFVFASLLYHVKIIPQLLAWQREATWKQFSSGELRGQTMAIVGPGRIGREIARLGKAFGMQVIAAGASPIHQRAPDSNIDRYVPYTSLDAVLAVADCVVLCCPLTEHTDGLIDRQRIARMKPGVALINIARGAVIDEDAMIAALQSGHIAFAALDVFRTEPLPPESPLWSMPNVLINPHSASTAREENERITDIFVANLERYLGGRYDEMTPLLDKRRGY